MDIQKLTKEQAVIISGFTGILCGEFSDFHADVEKRLGRGVQTFEFGFKKFATEVKKLYEADFIEMGTVDKEQAKAQAAPEIQQSKQSEIDDLKAQLKAAHESRIEFVEYCRKMESGNFVIVDKTDLELAIDALKDASNNDDDSFAHRAKDVEKALKNG